MTARNILVVGYPRSGNTWLNNLLAFHFNAPYYDAYVAEGNIRSGKPAGEGMFHEPDVLSGGMARPDQAKEVNAVIKTHELPQNLQSQHRQVLELVGYQESDPLVLVTREPKDVVVSYFYFTFFRQPRRHERRLVRIPHFLRHWYFLRFRLGSFALNVAREWSEFNLTWLSREPMIVHYEDLLVDPVRELERVCQAFGFEFRGDYAEKARDCFDFGRMVKAERRNLPHLKHTTERFYRTGGSGQWGTYFSAELRKGFDEIVCEASSRVGYV